ncbi:hypothetical protein BDL97_12G080700 [Sphagnum fallax]|nr:hypothetical protein BDL97_12G080700 [Sphagnum fallax]
MAWLGKVTLSDFAGAVTKLSESVKNIEKNFDSALGFDDVSEARSTSEKTTTSVFESLLPPVIQSWPTTTINETLGAAAKLDGATNSSLPISKPNAAGAGALDTKELIAKSKNPSAESSELLHSFSSEQQHPPSTDSNSSVVVQEEEEQQKLSGTDVPGLQGGVDPGTAAVGVLDKKLQDSHDAAAAPTNEEETEAFEQQHEIQHLQTEAETQLQQQQPEGSTGGGVVVHTEEDEVVDSSSSTVLDGGESESRTIVPTTENQTNGQLESGVIGHHLENADHQENNVSDNNRLSPDVAGVANGRKQGGDEDYVVESTGEVVGNKDLVMDMDPQDGKKLKVELSMMEAALQGAAKQSQLKADEISRLMIENEELKAVLDELKRKASDVELDALREEYQQRVSAAERKVYALTKERDMLRREQNRKSDSSILLKEKDEIIKQVMAEGEELSKKQAVQEGQMKKLRAQIRELEDEKQRLNSKLQVEEAKVESIRKDKAATEKALQESVERCQVELASQKEYYSKALMEAKDAAALAEARVDSEARAGVERLLLEATERETSLVQTIEELRESLTRMEKQAAVREDMMRSEIEDVEKRCQAAEVRYEELVTRMPDSTRPLLRQIEALQESAAMRTEAWSGVERSLNSRLQQAEAKAAAAQERERAVNERLTQTMSRMAVMEAQLSCLRAEQSQLSRSLEKERQRASESRQEYLAATEAAATQEGRARQLEEEIAAMKRQYRHDIKEEKARREALEQEIEQERAAMADYEKRIRAEGRAAAEKAVASVQPSELSTGMSHSRRWPSMSSQGSMEESFYLQASLDATPERGTGERFSFSERPPSPLPHFGKSMVSAATYEQLETHLRQKEGELASYGSRLAALESTRDSLAEELVKATTQCEQLRSEASLIPGMKAELESLRQRHTSALELMGERDEEVEELRADLSDVKQMYREQIDMLVSQIERLSVAMGSS